MEELSLGLPEAKERSIGDILADARVKEYLGTLTTEFQIRTNGNYVFIDVQTVEQDGSVVTVTQVFEQGSDGLHPTIRTTRKKVGDTEYQFAYNGELYKSVKGGGVAEGTDPQPRVANDKLSVKLREFLS